MIAIITYDNSHRKTQDLVHQLKARGHNDLHLLVIPWISRKSFTPLFKHRPSKAIQVNLDDYTRRMGISMERVEVEHLANAAEASNYEHILIGGAGILPDDLASNHKVINTHPGYLPYVKGLDAFKWSIYEGHPIGTTTHYISDKADEGELIEKREVQLYYEDDFFRFANRVYETEIEMIVDAIELIDSGKAPLTSLADDQFEPHRRMPHHIERKMMDKFEELRKQAPSIREVRN